jgi:glycosyltransferase involved in cell wall biosynthesis
VLICNVANSLWAWIPRLFGKPTALNVDGLDRKRRKWNFLGQQFLHFCEVLSPFTPTRVITDARTVQDYYLKRYGRRSDMIAYGAEAQLGGNHFRKFGLAERQYILYVARLEPENNPELVIKAYREVHTDWPLVIVGGNPYQPAYVDNLKSLADPRVIFAGPIYGDAYWALQKNAGVFVFAGEIGGIHPALIEAMAAGNAILYLDTRANQETAVGCGISFDHDQADLTKKLQHLFNSPENMQQLRDQARTAAQQNYAWDAVVDRYEALFASLLETRRVQARAL